MSNKGSLRANPGYSGLEPETDVFTLDDDMRLVVHPRGSIHMRLQEYGGAYRDRTDDLMLAKQPLSQLS